MAKLNPSKLGFSRKWIDLNVLHPRETGIAPCQKRHRVVTANPLGYSFEGTAVSRDAKDPGLAWQDQVMKRI